MGGHRGGLVQCLGAVLSKRASALLKWPRWLTAGWLAWVWGAMASAAWVSVPWTATGAIYAACAVSNIYVAFHVLWEDEFRRPLHSGG